MPPGGQRHAGACTAQTGSDARIRPAKKRALTSMPARKARRTGTMCELKSDVVVKGAQNEKLNVPLP
jgi:hypothetical protein